MLFIDRIISKVIKLIIESVPVNRETVTALNGYDTIFATSKFLSLLYATFSVVFLVLFF